MTDESVRCGLLWEGDVDLVLVMDALTGGPLTEELYRSVGVTSTKSRVERSAWRSGGRETDVLITGTGGTLLIEDKIDAPFQPLQPESYREEVLRLRGDNKDAWAIIVCPASRRSIYETSEAKRCFDAVVTLERLADTAAAFAQLHGERLAEASAVVLRAAAAPRPGARAPDTARAAWGNEYRRELQALAEPGMLVVGPGCFRTTTSLNAWFSDVVMEGLWGFGHLVPDGMVEVELQKSIHQRPMDIPDGASLAESARLWMIRIPVTPMTFEAPPSSQTDALNEAVIAALTLRPWLVDYARRRERSDAS